MVEQLHGWEGTGIKCQICGCERELVGRPGLLGCGTLRLVCVIRKGIDVW
jgi:hypothetical protein